MPDPITFLYGLLIGSGGVISFLFFRSDARDKRHDERYDALTVECRKERESEQNLRIADKERVIRRLDEQTAVLKAVNESLVALLREIRK